jgi:hypothetical protein
MAVNRTFECDNCGTLGKITLRGQDITSADIAFCPVCGADIFEPEDDDELDD